MDGVSSARRARPLHRSPGRATGTYGRVQTVTWSMIDLVKAAYMRSWKALLGQDGDISRDHACPDVLFHTDAPTTDAKLPVHQHEHEHEYVGEGHRCAGRAQRPPVCGGRDPIRNRKYERAER
jgi:hypothetical protein